MPILKTRRISSVLNLAQPLEPGKDRRDGPRRGLQPQVDVRGHDPFQVLLESAARDVREPVYNTLDFVVVQDPAHGSGIDPGWLEQDLLNGLVEFRDRIGERKSGESNTTLRTRLYPLECRPLEADTQDQVIHVDRLTGDQVRPLDDADAEAGQVVISRLRTDPA